SKSNSASPTTLSRSSQRAVLTVRTASMPFGTWMLPGVCQGPLGCWISPGTCQGPVGTRKSYFFSACDKAGKVAATMNRAAKAVRMNNLLHARDRRSAHRALSVDTERAGVRWPTCLTPPYLTAGKIVRQQPRACAPLLRLTMPETATLGSPAGL